MYCKALRDLHLSNAGSLIYSGRPRYPGRVASRLPPGRYFITKINNIMTTFKDLHIFFETLRTDYLHERVPNIVAEAATEFFKQRFTTKEWEGTAWKPTRFPVGSGSLMLRTGALLHSIRPKIVGPGRVVISAGDSKVPYARIHNEGGQIIVTPKMKKWAWAMHYQAGGSPKGQEPPPQAQFYKAMALKKTGSPINMPRRQFMGYSGTLNKQILAALKRDYNHFITQ